MTNYTLEIPKAFFQEEVRDGYKISAEMKKIWAVELDLLNKLLEVCQKYGLKCFADGGTLLGAVRHKGFIPWDDDIDVVMFRRDYEKLKSVAGEEFTEPYFFQCAYSDDNYIRGHAQLRNSNTTAILYKEIQKKHVRNYGIFIDIFVLDGVSQSNIKLKIQKLIVDICKDRMALLITDDKLLLKKQLFKKRILKTIGLNRIKLYRLMEAVLKICSIEHCEMVAPLGFVYETEKRIRNKHLYDEAELRNFECIKIPVPCGYHEFLSNRYGDYMKPSQEAATHGGIFFDTEKTYKKYLNEMLEGKLDYLINNP